MRTLFTDSDGPSTLDLQTAAVRLIQYFFIGVAVTAFMLLLSFLSFQISCDACGRLTLWPGLLVARLTQPMCDHTGVACLYLGIAISPPLYGLASYFAARLLKPRRKSK